MKNMPVVGQIIFAVLCLYLAQRDLSGQPVSKTAISLVILASLPWSLPWIAQFFQSFKAGTLFEVTFRELKQQVQENQQAVAAALTAGVGKPPAETAAKPAAATAGNVSFAGPSDEGSPSINDDPNKGRFGGSPVSNQRRLTATVKPFPGSSDLFVIHAEVTATTGTLPDGTRATFYLHPTFPQSIVPAIAHNGAATLDVVAWGAFTLGADIGGTRLELDLATQVPDAPAAFVLR